MISFQMVLWTQALKWGEATITERLYGVINESVASMLAKQMRWKSPGVGLRDFSKSSWTSHLPL